ncbi:MAG: urease subunit gamma [Candidatus Nitrosocosmicus sp.]|nr:urease subunit gamma [Candidatus Nitrosocosmicus sp.]MDN5867208.1 urease subunit gamma [Candidatus Nitrosocosmicus sp.]
MRDEIDETIFFNTFKIIETKIKRQLRINLNESIWFFCGCELNQLHLGTAIDEIRTNLSKILSEEMVMIGVVESMKKIEIEIKIVADHVISYNIGLVKPIVTIKN